MAEKISTGIPELDEIAGGGLPRPATIALIGEVGSGKSILARQISWNLLKQDFNVLYYSLDESADDVREDMRSFGWDISRFEEEGVFRFVDIFSGGIEVLRTRPDATPEECMDLTFDFAKFHKEGQDFCLGTTAEKKLVVLDSSSPMLTLMEAKEVFQFLQAIKFITRASGAIALGIMHLGIHDPKIEESCKQMADMIIELRSIEEGQHTRKYVRVTKTVGNFFVDPCPIEIRPSVGIVVHRVTVP